MAEINAERLRRAVLFYSATALVAISFVVAAAGIGPLALRLREAAHAELRHTVELRAMAAGEFVSRAAMVAQQVSSRTTIRDRLAAYEHGQVTQAALADFTSTVLSDALIQSAELDGIVRLGAKGEMVVAVGQPFPWRSQAVPVPTAKLPVMSRPLTINGVPHVVVAAPIIDRTGMRLGTDLVLIDARRLLEILHDADSLGGTGDIAVLLPGEPPGKLIPFRTASALSAEGRAAQMVARAAAGGDVPVVDASGDPILVAAGIRGSGWVMLMRMDAREANASIDHLVLGVTATAALLTVAGVLGLLKVLRPLTGGIIVHANDMRRQIDDLERAKADLHDKTRELTESNGELEQFAYVASHDLREPLRMISSYITLLERRYPDAFNDDGREFLQFARDGALRMDRMVLDLLEFSRVGRVSDPFAPVSLAEVAFVAVGNLALIIKEHSADVAIAADLPTVTGSREELIRLLQNLIGNALKYRHPERPPAISIAAKAAEHEWVVTVADNGIGIDAEYFKRIFEIFQRLHSRTEYEGTGIGLAICKKIVQHHGGRIWVESNPGEGATFFFTLPYFSDAGEDSHSP